MRKQRINQLEQMLAEEKEKLLEVEASLAGVGGLGQPMDVADTELSAYDNHPGRLPEPQTHSSLRPWHCRR